MSFLDAALERRAKAHLFHLRQLALRQGDLSQARAILGAWQGRSADSLGSEDIARLAIEQALAESERCFSCGTCIQCDNCVVYCPDMAVKPVGQGYTVLTDYCKGCGMCVKECPTGSMAMQEEMR